MQQRERAINDWKEALHNLELVNIKHEKTQGFIEKMEELREKVTKC